MIRTLQEQLTDDATKLDREHEKWWTLWQDAIDLINRKNILVGNGDRWEKRPRLRVFNDVAIKSAQTCTDGMQGYCVPQNVPWFKLVTENPKDMKVPGMRLYLEKLEEGLYNAFARSNFYTAINEFIYDGVTLNTAIMYMDEDPGEQRVRFMPMSINEVRVGEDPFGKVDRVTRKFRLDVPAFYSFFGDDVPEEFRRKYPEDAPNNSEIEILHYVGPRVSTRYDAPTVEGEPEFISVYMSSELKEPIRIRGYRTFPYIVWRWSKRPNDVYGWGPGLSGLATVKNINALTKDVLDASQRASKPPLVIRGWSNENFSIRPDALNFVDSPDAKVEKIDMVGNYPIMKDMLAELSVQIEKMFFVDIFLMLDRATRQMTAEEVSQRMGEKTAVMGAITGRLVDEVLRPIITRMRDIEIESGRIEKPDPQIVQRMTNKDFGIDFVGPLAQVQRRYHKTGGINTAIQQLAMIGQLNPQVMDLIDWDELAKRQATDSGMPEQLFLDEKTVMAIRENRAKQQQAMQQLQVQAAQAKIAKDMSGSIQPNSPAALMMQQGMQQGAM